MKMLIKFNQEPSLKASRIRAYVDPILKLFIDIIIIENFDNSEDRIDSSIINIIVIARNIVLTGLSNKKESKLLVKQKPKSNESNKILLLDQESEINGLIVLTSESTNLLNLVFCIFN